VLFEHMHFGVLDALKCDVNALALATTGAPARGRILKLGSWHLEEQRSAVTCRSLGRFRFAVWCV
jgi:hypothetical protein